MKVMMVYTYSELGNSALLVGQYYTHIKGTYPTVYEIEEVEHEINKYNQRRYFVKVVNVIPLAE